MNSIDRSLYNNSNNQTRFIYFRYLTNISLQVINVPRMKIANTPRTQNSNEEGIVKQTSMLNYCFDLGFTTTATDLGIYITSPSSRAIC